VDEGFDVESHATSQCRRHGDLSLGVGYRRRPQRWDRTSPPPTRVHSSSPGGMAPDSQPSADRRVLQPNSPDLYCYSGSDVRGGSLAPTLCTTTAPTLGVPQQQSTQQLHQQSPSAGLGQSYLHGPHHLPIGGMGVLSDLQRGFRENVAHYPVQGHTDANHSGIFGTAPAPTGLHATSSQARVPASRASGEP